MFEGSGEWREERLFVLRQLEQLTGDHQKLGEALAAAKDREEKLLKDLNEAHTRIRALQAAVRTARLKAWGATAAASFLGVIVVELVRHILQ